MALTGDLDGKYMAVKRKGKGGLNGTNTISSYV